MAEAWLATHDGVEARSAGTQPEPVNLNAVAVMREAGIDISYKASNHIDEAKSLLQNIRLDSWKAYSIYIMCNFPAARFLINLHEKIIRKYWF